MEQRFDIVYQDSNEIERTPRPWTWDEIRSERLPLLEAADIEQRKAFDAWMLSGEHADATSPKWLYIAAWAAYAQTLRDLPQTYAEAGPNSVNWPAAPGSDV